MQYSGWATLDASTLRSIMTLDTARAAITALASFAVGVSLLAAPAPAHRVPWTRASAGAAVTAGVARGASETVGACQTPNDGYPLKGPGCKSPAADLPAAT
jgi:hypothetical protein